MNARPLIVRKYGGSSVAGVDRLRKVACDIKKVRGAGNRLVIVVSAMGGSTDDLVRQALEFGCVPREQDVLMATGEQVSIALLTMALADLDCPAFSLTGPQAGILTSNDHSRARIIDIRPDRIHHILEQDAVAVVAGFQGLDSQGDLTTLGRGGSDTTAVALASALEADRCEIMSDVDGVFTADPRKVPAARLIPEISGHDMLRMANFGARVLDARAVELAMRCGVNMYLGSTFGNQAGTLVHHKPLQSNRVTGLALDENAVLLCLEGGRPGLKLLAPSILARAGIPVKSVWGRNGECCMFLAGEDLPQARQALEANASVHLSVDRNKVILSVVGPGINLNAGASSGTLDALSRLNIEPEFFFFSEERLSFGLDRESAEPALQALHELFFELPFVA